MEPEGIEDWTRSLRVPWSRRRGIARELRAHVAESQRELELAGWEHEAARRESVRRLGDPESLASDFREVYRRPARAKLGVAAILAGALLVGAYGGGTLASATSVHAKQTLVHPGAPTHHRHLTPPRPADTR